MNIYLARHGETDWNREHRLQGLRDIPLNDTGICQSWQLAAWHQKTAVTRIATSPLVRARRTAQVLGKLSGRPSFVDDRLREIDHGPWTGLRLIAIERAFPHEFSTWTFSPEKLKLTSGEGLHAVYRRCAGVLSDLITTGSGDILVVSHGVVNAVLLCVALGTCLSRIREFSLSNGAVSALKIERRRIIAVEREIDVATSFC